MTTSDILNFDSFISLSHSGIGERLFLFANACMKYSFDTICCFREENVEAEFRSCMDCDDLLYISGLLSVFMGMRLFEYDGNEILKARCVGCSAAFLTLIGDISKNIDFNLNNLTNCGQNNIKIKTRS